MRTCEKFSFLSIPLDLEKRDAIRSSKTRADKALDMTWSSRFDWRSSSYGAKLIAEFNLSHLQAENFITEYRVQ